MYRWRWKQLRRNYHLKLMCKNNLIIFLKYPEPKKVKTRLGNVIGFDNASRVYSSIAKHLITNLSDSADYSFTIFFSPTNKLKEIKNWLHNYGFDLVPQNGITLGDRISHAFEYSFSMGFKNTIVIGSDCIDLEMENIETAFKILSSNNYDSILGPTTDGGYYLIGLQNINYPEIFKDIEWSTNTVFNQTIQKLESLHLNYNILEYFNDIDEISDLNSKVIKIVNSYDPNLRIFE